MRRARCVEEGFLVESPLKPDVRSGRRKSAIKLPKIVKKEPAIYERLLVARNRNWLPQLEALFNRSGRAFVVVGAAHLIGPDGLIAMLKAKGYLLEQM